MSANTGTCSTHGAPPAGDGRISLLSPVSRGKGKDTVRESNNYSLFLFTWTLDLGEIQSDRLFFFASVVTQPCNHPGELRSSKYK